MVRGQASFGSAAAARLGRVGLEDETRPGIMLIALPGLALSSPTGRAARAPAAALPVTRNQPLARLLAARVWYRLRAVPGDRVAAFRFVNAAGEPLFLLHQLFGARGNTVLLDGEAKLLLGLTVRPTACWPQSRRTDDLASRRCRRAGRIDLSACCPAPPDRPSWLTAAETAARTSLNRQLQDRRALVDNLTRDLAERGTGRTISPQGRGPGCPPAALSQGASEVAVARPARRGSHSRSPWIRPCRQRPTWRPGSGGRERPSKGRKVIAARLDNARLELDTLEAAGENLDAVPRTGRRLPWSVWPACRAGRRITPTCCPSNPARDRADDMGPKSPPAPSAATW